MPPFVLLALRQAVPGHYDDAQFFAFGLLIGALVLVAHTIFKTRRR